MSLSNAPSTSNVSENWIAQFTADNKHCLDFDGTNDKVTFGNIFSLYTTYTIEAWVKPDTVSTRGKAWILYNGNQDYDENTEANNVTFSLYQSDNDVGFYYQYGASSNKVITFAGNQLTADTWVHLALVRDNSDDSIKLYVNGVLNNTSSSTPDPTGGGSGVFSLGYGEYTSGTNDQYFNGEIAHARVWNVAKSAADILQYMNRAVIGTESGLQGYWKLNEGTGTSVDDLTSNDNDGTVSGATWSINGFDKFIFWFGLSFLDTDVDNDHHHGSILNKSITIRDSIDLTKSTSSTGNISITSSNFKTDGTDFYKILFNGDNNYHNKEVRLYAQFSGESDLDDCQRIFTGRLVDITLDQNQNIKMQINSHRPWDKIEFPQTKHSKYNIYQPVVYGSYNYSDATSGATNDAAFGGVFPVPILYTNRNTIVTVLPKTYTGGSHCYIHHYVGYDWFCSIKTEGSGMTDATTTEGGVDILETPASDRATGWIRTNQSSFDFSGSVTYLTNPENATDFNLETGAADTTTYATADINDIDDLRYLTVQTPNKQFAVTLITGVYIKYSILWDDGSGDDQQYEVDFFGNEYDPNLDDLLSSPSTKVLGSNISTHQFTFNTTPANAVDSENALVCPDELLIKWKAEHNAPLYDHEDHELRVYDIQMRYENRFNYNDNDRKRVADLKYFYCGAAGLTASWDSGAISHGHDAHRDMLIRFAGVSTEDPEVNTGEAWSVLNTDRTRNTANDADIDTWKVRYWQLEPTSLKDALDKMAYESGFVSKFSPSNKLKYIYVKKSSELSALLNLTKDDIANVSVSTTGIDNVHATMDISNKVNAAETSRYYAVTRATDASLITKYNLGDKEGIAAVNLDMNVGTIPTTADSDCNADWYSYMHNIIGDMKIIVDCQVVNPAKGYQLETGDIVTFTDMPVEMFGTDFATDKYFMIIETKRSPGKVSITAREVG